MTFPGLPSIGLGLLIVHLVVAALLLRWHWQRRDRPPVREKLLRGPGERLQRRLDALEDRTAWLALATTLLPLTVLIAGLTWLPHQPAGARAISLLAGTLLGFVGLAATGGWLLWRTLTERREARRSLQGERTVAQSLATLVPAGYRVFHDVPTESRDAGDNIHHVVVGPAGIFAIQTQTHARRKPLPGRKDHEIMFDGDQLVYPWGQDTRGIIPARNKAEWLADWLYQVLGERMPVSAVLTFPGWWVTPITQRDVRVHNPGQIAALILQSAGEKLNEAQFEMIERQLEARCRDVET